MQKKKEAAVLFGVNGKGFPLMENQTEKTKQNRMETGVRQCFFGL